jgi:hypothetical protein
VTLQTIFWAFQQEQTTENETEKKKNKKTPVEWEAIKLDKSSVEEFNEELDGHIDEELRNIDEQWEPGMDCPYERLSNASSPFAFCPPDQKVEPCIPWFSPG